MNILVTGSSGFVASHLIPALAGQGHTVTGVDRESGGTLPLARFVQGDLLEKSVARESLEGVSCVVHLAAAKADWGLSVEEYYRDNLDATRTLLEAGREKGIRRWVFFSTVSAMGPSEVPIDETSGLNPIEPYGGSKAEAERLFTDFSKATADAGVLILRPSVVFGPGNPKADLPFVGEAPGREEDEQGMPYDGAAGQLLSQNIEAMGKKREDVFIVNTVLCRPPNNRNPEPDEVAACRPFLREQIRLVAPRVIVTLGTFAAHAILETDEPISRLRGRWQSAHGARVMPTFHPAYLLRSPQHKKDVWADMKNVRDYLAAQPGAR